MPYLSPRVMHCSWTSNSVVEGVQSEPTSWVFRVDPHISLKTSGLAIGHISRVYLAVYPPPVGTTSTMTTTPLWVNFWRRMVVMWSGVESPDWEAFKSI